MAQKEERIPCVAFEDNRVELFSNFADANAYALKYISQFAKEIISTDKFGPNCKTITFIDHNGHEQFVTISTKVVH